MKNKLSWGIALLPFVPSVWMQGQEQKQGIGTGVLTLFLS